MGSDLQLREGCMGRVASILTIVALVLLTISATTFEWSVSRNAINLNGVPVPEGKVKLGIWKVCLANERNIEACFSYGNTVGYRYFNDSLIDLKMCDVLKKYEFCDRREVTAGFVLLAVIFAGLGVLFNTVAVIDGVLEFIAGGAALVAMSIWVNMGEMLSEDLPEGADLFEPGFSLAFVIVSWIILFIAAVLSWIDYCVHSRRVNISSE